MLLVIIVPVLVVVIAGSLNVLSAGCASARSGSHSIGIPVNDTSVVMPVTISVAVTIGAAPRYNDGAAAVIRRTVVRPVRAVVGTVCAIWITVPAVIWRWPAITGVVASTIPRISAIFVGAASQTQSRSD